jgi:hypothetical protein
MARVTKPWFPFLAQFAWRCGSVCSRDRESHPVQNGFAVELALDGDEGMEELVGDVGEDCGAAWGDAVLHDEDQELGQELIDLIGGLEVVELNQEVGGKVDVNGLRRLDLQRSVTKAQTGAEGAKTTLATACREVTAHLVAIGDGRSAGRARAGCLGIHSCPLWGVRLISRWVSVGAGVPPPWR